ncbi:MAG TPA: hypothetical protein VK716_11045 [Terracidiphilus sp.]|jgi:hypothetical protein|nr:hypothetical protein [Terracidiphilus sp.]
MANLDKFLWLAGLLAEAATVGILFYRRVWRNFPIFCAYCIFDLISGVGMVYIFKNLPDNYSAFYFGQVVLSSLLEFGVLVELGWAVLRPIRKQLPRITPYVLALVILLIGAAIWPFDAVQSIPGAIPAIHSVMHVQQTTAILRVLVFLLLASTSQFLSIGWRDRELQIATGLGFYSLFSLGAAMLQAHQTTLGQYARLNQLLIGANVCSLLYWAVSFAQKEAERREFTPQMQNLLLAVAGVARANRETLGDRSITDSRRRRDR